MQPHEFWQEVSPPAQGLLPEAYHDAYPAELGDGRLLWLPIRTLADGEHGLASLIINQASFQVLDALAGDLAERLKPFAPEVVVGLPTLGLTLAAAVAGKLGHSRYVPLGTSRKFWYSEALSTPLSSITTPEAHKRLYIDPRMLPLIQGPRVALVDDVISSGTSMLAGLKLLDVSQIEPVVIGAAMLQSDRWRAALSAHGPQWLDKIAGGFRTPMLTKGQDGLWRDLTTAPAS